MKKVIGFLLILIMIFSVTAFPVHAEKGPGLPAVFRVHYESEEKTAKNGNAFIYKEYLITCSDKLNALLKNTADLFESTYTPSMTDKCSKPRRNNRMDIHTVWSRTGTRWLSALVLCRWAKNRVQMFSPFYAVTWDLEKDRRVSLTDIFASDSEAWQILSAGVRTQLASCYPLIKADEQRLCSISSIENLALTPFTLHAEELTLHFSASDLYGGQSGLLNVRFYYTDLRPYMTQEALEQTDNSAYPKVALSFDDGPAYNETAGILNNLRKFGARGTFFVVGSRIGEFKDILHRTYDENNLVESHTNGHNDASKQTSAEIVRTVQRSQKAISDVIGPEATMMRPPYGTAAPYTRSKVGLPVVMWNLDTKDWTGKTPSAVLSTVKSKVKNGDLILMHDIKTNTVESSVKVCEYLYEQGYMMVSVEELMRCGGVIMQSDQVYYRCQDGLINDDSY